jgi:hypothetical protein
LLHVVVVEVHKHLLNFLRAHVRDAKLVLVDHERLLQVFEAASAIVVLQADEGEREVNFSGVDAIVAELSLEELLNERQVLQGLIIVVSIDRAVGQVLGPEVLLKNELLPDLSNLREVAARLRELLLDAEELAHVEV